MDDAARRVRQAAQDARSNPVDNPFKDMVWEGDMLVPRYESPLDKETLDERSAHGMGPNWEETRRDE